MNTASNPPFYIHERYRLAEWLGKGRVGTVYRAYDEVLDRSVVIKFIQPETGAAYGERFMREARAVARLSHPNIMAIYDVGEQDGWSYLVLEYVPGRDLRRWQAQLGGKLPLEDALAVTRAILHALHAAHEHGIVHRDIKPENILITPEKHVKVADFGLALAEGEARLTQDGAIVGTALYLPPESISSGQHDARSDLYAVGAVLYEMLTGRAPFDGENLVSVIAHIMQGMLMPPSLLNPLISPALDTYILRLMVHEPGQRFASAMDALAALPAADPQAESPTSEPRILVGAGSGSGALLEAERRRLAAELKVQAIEPLNLLLSQVSTFEQTLGAHPQARMALSVIAALARQVLQQTRDLEANLHPQMLETIGLEPALDALREQMERSKGLRLQLDVERISPRLPANLELALFRFVQELLDVLPGMYVSQASLRVARQDERLLIGLEYPSASRMPDETVTTLRGRVDALKGQFRMEAGRVEVSIPLQFSTEFTPRELEVLQCLVESLSNKEIALRLGISARTVNYHLDNIYAKLGVGTRTEAALLAMRHGWARRPSDV